MDAPVQCTHCRVVMTSWSAEGSPTRYYQCPFCGRTFCSAYGEVFRRSAGARWLGPAPGSGETPGSGARPVSSGRRPPAAPAGPAAEDVPWRELQGRAARWFARVEADERRWSSRIPRPAPGTAAATAASARSRRPVGR